MPSPSPRFAEDMLLDPRRIAYACDYRRNPSFSRADARTADWQGRIMAELLSPSLVRDTEVLLARTVLELLNGADVRLDPIRLGQVGKRDGGRRAVWIMSYTRRCFSNLVAGVLSDVTTSQFHPHVRAYVPGLRNVVQESILDVAEAVHGRRVVHFVKEDIKSFFDVLPHELVRSSLTHYGLTERVTRLVMNLVRAPRWVGKPQRGRLDAVHVGTPMGLPESAVLANMACFELDNALAGLGRRVHIMRYSDDVFVGAAQRDDAVHAARIIQRWCRKLSMKLKGVHHMALPRSRVRDIRNQRIALLGAEIDRNGTVHVPRGGLAERMSQIRIAMEELDSSHAATFSGRSVYAGGVGVTVQDHADIYNSASSFVDYWRSLNESEAAEAASVMNRSFSGLLQGEQPVTVWSATLGLQPVAGQEDVASNHNPNGLVGEQTHSGLSAGVRRTQACNMDWDYARDSHWDNDHRQATAGRGARAPAEVESHRLSSIDAPREIDDEGNRVTIPSAVEYEGDVLPSIHPGEYVDSQVAWSPHGFDSQRSDLCMGANPDSPAPPRDRDLGNELTVHVQWRVADDGAAGTSVSVAYGNMGTVVHDHPSVGPEMALVRTLRAAIRNQRVRSDGRLLVRVPGWLPKHLLSRHRRFRSATLFAEVLRLHREAEELGLHVTLTGHNTSQ